MAVTKAELFNTEQKTNAGLAKALGHPARIAILEILARRTDCICGDITEELPLAQSTVSQHLKVLKEAGIIKGEINGVRICYCLNEEVLEGLESFSEFIKTTMDSIQKNCC